MEGRLNFISEKTDLMSGNKTVKSAIA
jgi:hypothetical protein